MHNTRKILILFCLSFLILFLTGCSKDYIAIVNGQKILKSDFERNFKQLKEYYLEENEVDLKKYLLEDMIVDAILLQEANKRNIAVSTEAIEESYQELISKYDSEESMLKDLERFGFTKEQLLLDIKEQLIIQEYLSGIKEVDKHIKDLLDKSEIKIVN